MTEVSIILIPRDLGETVERFLPELRATLPQLPRALELICIEDGGCPSAPRALAALGEAWPTIRLLSIDPAWGLSVAMSAALEAASGETVCVVEATGRYAAAEIPRLLDRLSRADAVFGCRRAGLVTRALRSLLRWPRQLVQGIDVRDPACLLWAARREAVTDLQLAPGVYPLLPKLIAEQGFRVGELRVETRRSTPALRTDRRWWPLRNSSPTPYYTVREHAIAPPQEKRAVA